MSVSLNANSGGMFTASASTSINELTQMLMRNVKGERPSLFNMSTDCNFIVNAFSKIHNISSAEEIYKSYRSKIDDSDVMMHRLIEQRDAYILACIEAMNASILTTFSKDRALKVASAYGDNGFDHPEVSKMMSDIKDVFFKDLLNDKNGKELINDIVCLSVETLNFPDQKEYFNEHFTIKFLCKSLDKPFSISIPVKENSQFFRNNFEDTMRGRFLLHGLNNALCPISLASKMNNSKMKFYSCLAAEFNPEVIAKYITMYLTTNKLDNAEVHNFRSYDTQDFGNNRWLW